MATIVPAGSGHGGQVLLAGQQLPQQPGIAPDSPDTNG